MRKVIHTLFQVTREKGLLTRMTEWWRAVCARSENRNRHRRTAAMVRESAHRVQIREFDGEMYLALDNVPVLPADGIAWDLPTAVAVSREAWVKYHLNNA